jgi:hypothetical protein
MTEIREFVIPPTSWHRNISEGQHFHIKWVLEDLLPRVERSGDIDVASGLRIGGDISQLPPPTGQHGV